MKSYEGQGTSPEKNEKEVTAERSPAEKIEGDQPPGQTIPGAENPESKEIKKEINPNTE